jgi:hypothetical protein
VAADGPVGPDGPDPRDELDAAPPFATWPRIYAALVVALAAQVIVYAALTAALR